MRLAWVVLLVGAVAGADEIRLHDIPGSDGEWQEGVAVVPAPWQTVEGWLTDYARWQGRFPDIAWAQQLGDDAAGRHVVRFHSRLAGRTFVIHEDVRPHLLTFAGQAPSVRTQGRIWILDNGDGTSTVKMQSSAKVRGIAGWFASKEYRRASAFKVARSHLGALIELCRGR